MAPEIRRNKEIQICPGSISRLSEEVVVEILLRISSVKTIALCKCVCKSWRGLISDPRFAELHLARSKICPLVRNLDEQTTLRTVYLLEDEDGFHSAHCMCTRYTERCEICLSGTTTITNLKIPVGQLWTEVIECTCNGLLCFFKDRGIAVCNPITGEFVTLPDWDHMNNNAIAIMVCGLGLDPKTGRYKVVMLYSLPVANSKDLVVLKADVHVLGTDSWRELDTPDVSLELGRYRHLSSPTFFDGALYWVYKDKRSETCGMVSLDLDSERLRYRSLPSLPPHDGIVFHEFDGVVVLRGRLCVYSSYSRGKLDILVMDECSVSDSSSTEWILHDLSEVQVYFKLICSLDDGALLMFGYSPANELIYYDPPRAGPRFKRLRFADGDALEIVAYTPSFLSLKDIVRPGNAEVLNVYSRSENPVGDVDTCSPSF